MRRRCRVLRRIEHHVVVGEFGDALAAPLRVEAHRVGRQLVVFGVVDLVEERGHVLVAVVAQHDARVFERHGEVAVEARFGLTMTGIELMVQDWACPQQKKSPIGHCTEGESSPSQ